MTLLQVIFNLIHFNKTGMSKPRKLPSLQHTPYIWSMTEDTVLPTPKLSTQMLSTQSAIFKVSPRYRQTSSSNILIENTLLPTKHETKSQIKKEEHRYKHMKTAVAKGQLTGRIFQRHLEKPYKIKDLSPDGRDSTLKLFSFLLNGKEFRCKARFETILKSPKRFGQKAIEQTIKLQQLLSEQ